MDKGSYQAPYVGYLENNTSGWGFPDHYPEVRDRIVLRALFQVLAEVFPEAISNIAQVKIATIIENMERFEYGEFLKIDVNQFYPSIDHSILLKKIKTRIKKPEILKLIRVLQDRACGNRRHKVTVQDLLRRDQRRRDSRLHPQLPIWHSQDQDHNLLPI